MQPGGNYAFTLQGGATATATGVDVQLEVNVGGNWVIHSAFAAGNIIPNPPRLPPGGTWSGQSYTGLQANTQYRVTARLNYTVTLPPAAPVPQAVMNSVIVTTP